MKRSFIVLGCMLSVLLKSEPVQACGTCALDKGGAGQSLMLVCMLTIPFVVVGIGFAALRRIVKRMEKLAS